MKFTKSILAIVILCALAFTASAQSPTSLSFIGAGGSGGTPEGATGYLWMTPTSTNLNGAATLIYQKGTYKAFGTTAITNALNPSVTYTNGQLIPLYVTNSSGIRDVELWGNRDGTAAIANLSVHVIGVGAAFTNVVTLNFATIPANGDLPVTTGSGLFSFAITGNGLTDAVASTNISASAIQGCRKLRLLSVVNTNAGTNGFLVNAWVNGFKPAGN
jgi:hypothetical protein